MRFRPGSSRLLPASSCLLLLLFWTVPLAVADDERVAKQRQLDHACEAARQKTLAPVRRDMVEECVAKEKREQEDCETAYSHYGERTGARPPLFYDLPECVAAADFQKSTRQAR